MTRLFKMIGFAARYCRRCGAKVTNEHADYCPVCGESL